MSTDMKSYKSDGWPTFTMSDNFIRRQKKNNYFHLCLLFLVSSFFVLPSSAVQAPISPHHQPYLGQQAHSIVPLRSHSLISYEEQIAFLQRQNERVRSLDAHSPQPRAFLETPDKHTDIYKAIIPMSEFRHCHFVGPVKIGTPPQTLYLIFDTGSTNLQVVGSGCPDKSCTKVQRFDPSKSRSFQPSKPLIKVDITFGTGKIHSLLGTDTVAIGPFAVEGQTLGVVDHESATTGKSNIFDHIDFQGIVGFGFPSLATAGRVPFFDNIINRDDSSASEFAIYMGHPGKFGASPHNVSSAFFIGGVDPRFYESPIQMVPVVREHYWEVGLDSFWIGEHKFCCEEGTANFVIIDSGTSFNTLPFPEFSKFREMVPKRPCGVDFSNLKSFPTLTYKLTGGVDVVITPEMYVIPTQDGDCEPAFMQIEVSSEFGHAYLLGSLPYMRHYFTVFRRGRNGHPSMIGIAKARHSSDGTSFLQSLEI